MLIIQKFYWQLGSHNFVTAVTLSELVPEQFQRIFFIKIKLILENYDYKFVNTDAFSKHHCRYNITMISPIKWKILFISGLRNQLEVTCDSSSKFKSSKWSASLMYQDSRLICEVYKTKVNIGMAGTITRLSRNINCHQTFNTEGYSKLNRSWTHQNAR